jgi:BirA family biotin operon repressor/biotin-[acetyl-CoA-carboxylase] ligase
MAARQPDAARSALGRPRLHVRRCPSTNLLARDLAQAGAPHGTLVTADEQTAGRGRHERRWWAPPRSALLMSLLLRTAPDERPDGPGLLPLAAGVAVCDAVELDARLKWPNDVVLERPGPTLAKLAGILVEGRLQAGWLILGIGVNVAVALDDAPPELRATLASLGASPDDIEPLLERLLRALERRLQEPPQLVLEAWRERDALRGREIAWDDAGGVPGREAGERGVPPSRQGRADGVDGSGRLIVERPGGGRVTLQAADVHLRAAR